MKKIKRLLSALLLTSLSLVFVLSTLTASGVTVSLAASSSTVTIEMWMKMDYEYALVKGKKVDINPDTDAAPYAYGGDTAYIPLAAMIAYRGGSYTVDGDSVTVTLPSGEVEKLTVGSTAYSGGDFLLPVVKKGEDIYLSVVSVNTLFGTKSSYNRDVGVIVFSTISSPSTSLANSVDNMGALLFDRPSASTIYADMLNTVGSADTHPRLLVDQATFDNLRTYYKGEIIDETFSQRFIDFCAIIYANFTRYFYYDEATGVTTWKSESARLSVRQPFYLYDENGNRLIGKTEYSYVDENGETVTLTVDGSGRGDGYDYGGRSSVDTFTTPMKYYAFLWQMTGEQKFVDAFYLMGVEVGKWEHWGEGHFLDCADGSVEFALGLDWIYHAFDNEPEKRDELASILYEKGMMKGYYSILCDSLYKKGSSSSIDLSASSASRRYQYGTHASLSGKQTTYLHISNTAGTSGWRTINRDNNWQTVCGSGMITAALMLSEYDAYRENALFVIEQYLLSLERCLLQYAPDGAYIESPGYWGYGTNTLMITLAGLKSSLGTTYGYDDIIGLYDSFYYTIGIADGDYKMWNYHDSSEGRVSYTSFYLASRMFDDPTLAYLRNGMPMGYGIMDVLFYDPTLADGAAPEEMPLDYNFKAIDTATFRSDYTSGATYTGLHAGPNQVAHGDMDCGNFTLTMGGVKWITDPGCEDYNVKGFWGSGENGTRYKLYCKSLEGHSTVMIRNDSSIPRGQTYTTTSTNGYAVIDEFYSDELGGYAITDMTTEYGSGCISGKRGVLLTNSRSTVVLQDQISFSKATDLAWVLNLNGALYVDPNGKYVIAHSVSNEGKQVQLRVSLLTDNPSLKLRLMKSPYSEGMNGKYETVFPTTYTKTNNNDERARDPVQRLIIEANGVTDFNVAVVFQILRHEDEIVPYSYTDMAEWKTESDEWVKDANSDINYEGTPTKPQYNYKQFYNANQRLAAAYEANDLVLVGEILRETCHILSSYDDSNSSISAEAAKYRAYRRQYNLMLRDANKAFSELLFGGS